VQGSVCDRPRAVSMQRPTPAASAFVSMESVSDMTDEEALLGATGNSTAPRITMFTAITLSVAAGLALTAFSLVHDLLTRASTNSSISAAAILMLNGSIDGALGVDHELVNSTSTNSNISAAATPMLNNTLPGVDYESEYNQSEFLLVPNFTATSVGSPSLFCWCIMLTVGNHPLGWMEEKLIKQQLELGMGMFACNEWAVMSDISVSLNRWGTNGFPRIPGGRPSSLDMPTWEIGSTMVQTGVKSNSLNSVIFKKAWDVLRSSRKLESHDWIVKVDPDAVWFPDRLRTHLKVYTVDHGNGLPDDVYLHNCVRFQTMQGPIEVMSKRAATTLQTNMKQCGGLWGTDEDQFLVKCLKQFGVSSYIEKTLLNDKHCDGYNNCYNAWKVAFHPFEETEGFMDCHGKASLAALEKEFE